MLSFSLLKVCPIHLYFLFLMVSCIGFCPLLRHSSSFVIFSDQCMLRILRRHLFIKIWSLFKMVLFDFHVSQPYRSTDFTLLSKILNFICLLSSLVFHIGVSCA